MPQATERARNGPDQWLAPTGLSTPLGFVASPLHRVVMSFLDLFPLIGDKSLASQIDNMDKRR
jgi:hypothetical protein